MNPGVAGPNAFYPQNSLYPQNVGFYQPNNYDSSQSTAQSNSHSHGNGPFGSQNADALAAAQGIHSDFHIVFMDFFFASFHFHV